MSWFFSEPFHDAARCGAVRCGAVRCDAVRCGSLQEFGWAYEASHRFSLLLSVTCLPHVPTHLPIFLPAYLPTYLPTYGWCGSIDN